MVTCFFLGGGATEQVQLSHPAWHLRPLPRPRLPRGETPQDVEGNTVDFNDQIKSKLIDR